MEGTIEQQHGQALAVKMVAEPPERGSRGNEVSKRQLGFTPLQNCFVPAAPSVANSQHLVLYFAGVENLEFVLHIGHLLEHCFCPLDEVKSGPALF